MKKITVVVLLTIFAYIPKNLYAFSKINQVVESSTYTKDWLNGDIKYKIWSQLYFSENGKPLKAKLIGFFTIGSFAEDIAICSQLYNSKYKPKTKNTRWFKVIQPRTLFEEHTEDSITSKSEYHIKVNMKEREVSEIIVRHLEPVFGEDRLQLEGESTYKVKYYEDHSQAMKVNNDYFEGLFDDGPCI